MGYNFAIMLKLLILYAAILATFTGNLSGGPDQSSDSHKQEVNQGGYPKSGSVSPAVQDDQRSQPTNPSAPQPPSGDAPSQWALVIVGIITCGVIGWQSYETHLSARAANRNLELIKTKERARLFLDVANINPIVGVKPTVEMIVRNAGETRAFLGVACGALYISESESLDGVVGWDLLRIHDTVMDPGESSLEIIKWCVNREAQYTEEIISSSKWFIHLHGTIIFRDAFENTWSRKFHYIWRSFGGKIVFFLKEQNATGYWECRLPACDEQIKPLSRFRKWVQKMESETNPQNPN